MVNGTIVGDRYEIIETVGKGGMAIVYKAKCMLLNRYVALKVLRPEFREDKEFIGRFKAEAQSAAALSHPNIVSIYDVVQDGELDYIVMEHVEGVTLKQYLEVQGAIPWREAVDYAAQICAGLDHAHKKGIIHKDIKPHNIMITREGTLKITDFGIAKVISSSTIKTGNATMGSVHYFSPEQARGGYTDYKTDIYSMGVVLYEMLTGKLPFEGDTAISIAMQHIEKEPVSPREINPEIPEALENVVLRAMCKDQSVRYNSVMEMMVDLKKAYTGNTVEKPLVAEKDKKAFRQETVILPQNLTGSIKKGKRDKKKDVLSIVLGSVTGFIVVGLLFLLGYHFLSPASGGSEVELPSFINMTVEDAKRLVTNSGIEITIEKEEVSQTMAAGKIISQSPKASTMVKENSTVKVVVSKGAGEFPMPDLVNRKEEDAKKLLDEKSLLYSVVEEHSDTIPEGYVLRQTPEAGTYIEGSTSVVIYVSSGKESTVVEVPNLLGLSESEAKAALLDLNLTWGDIVEAESTKPKGYVISQSIRPGIEVKEQTSIDIKISKGKKDETASPSPTATVAPTQAPTASPGITILPPNAGTAQ